MTTANHVLTASSLPAPGGQGVNEEVTHMAIDLNQPEVTLEMKPLQRRMQIGWRHVLVEHFGLARLIGHVAFMCRPPVVWAMSSCQFPKRRA